MNTTNIIRAWKDEEYRLSLSDAERAMLPEHPAGWSELTDTEMGTIVGGRLIFKLASTLTVGYEICCSRHTLQDCPSYTDGGKSACLCVPKS